MASEISGDSPQAVAYRLLEVIAINEGMPLGTGKSPDKKWILATYEECIRTVLTIQRYGSYGTG